MGLRMTVLRPACVSSGRVQPGHGSEEPMDATLGPGTPESYGGPEGLLSRPGPQVCPNGGGVEKAGRGIVWGSQDSIIFLWHLQKEHPASIATSLENLGQASGVDPRADFHLLPWTGCTCVLPGWGWEGVSGWNIHPPEGIHPVP